MLMQYLSVSIILVTHTLCKDGTDAYPIDFDCPMRQLSFSFAMEIQPNLSADQLQEIADALNGAKESINKSCVQIPDNWIKKHRNPPSWDDLNNSTASLYVDYINGNDRNNGISIDSPLQHLDTAIKVAQTLYGKHMYKKIILRQGRHYLRNTIHLSENDNNLLITNYNNELVEISGATPIKCNWETNEIEWKIFNQTDGIYGIPPGPGMNTTDGKIIYLGKYNNFNDCKNRAVSLYKQYGFGSFTWQNGNAGGWSYTCYGTVGFQFETRTTGYSTTAALINTYQCKITNSNITSMMGLRVNGSRAIRSRFPNGNPEAYPCGFCSNLKAPNWIPPSCSQQPDIEYNPSYPIRNNSAGNFFQYYQLGIGGCCKQFMNQAGYWCGNKTQGGGAFTYLIPSGLNYTGVLPNAPYSNITDAVIQTWRPQHWSSWMFLADPSRYNRKESTIMFKKGGFQGARGADSGAEFYIENVREELDFPTEYYFNKSTKILYYFNNGTGEIDNNILFEVTNLKVLLNMTGTMNKPVENQIIRGITFKDTQYTYLDSHSIPSGGDWALQRTGAIYLDGVRNITITKNIFTRLDGIAISVNRYARDVVIAENEIVWHGDSAVTMWGDTTNITFSNGDTMGWDGTNGNQPRGTQFISNFVHEIGIWEKQSSMWFQAKSCSNLIENNIFFNGPRAAINFNDGFGGNSTVRKNLIFNTCRESGDHGPFNSWDRQVFVTSVANGTPSVTKAWDHIYSNFIISNYNAGFAVDNDDGSQYYDTHSNVFVYGWVGLKSNEGGHSNHHYNNIYAYLNGDPNYGNWFCFAISAQLEGYQDWYHNNTCIINRNAPNEYAFFDCKTQNTNNQWPKLGNNLIYQMNDTNLNKTGLCGLNEKAFQQKYPGVDDGTIILGKPNNTQILAQAKELLF